MIEIIKKEEEIREIKKGMFLLSDDGDELIFTTEDECDGEVNAVVIWVSSSSPYKAGWIDDFLANRFVIFEGDIKIWRNSINKLIILL